MQRVCWLLLAVFFETLAYAQQPSLRVSSVAWHGLTADEKAAIQSHYIVEAMGSESFGTIIDIQGIDRSTPGTTLGANLGGAIGSAAYVDKAFSGDNDYSAKSHLAAIVLGGILGSTLDKQAQSKYQFRYAVKLGNGSITYQDQISSDPFRHPIGVCVAVPAMMLLPDQQICTQTAESLRQVYIPSGSSVKATITSDRQIIRTADKPTQEQPDVLVNCKANNLAVVRTTAIKCTAIQGVIVQ